MQLMPMLAVSFPFFMFKIILSFLHYNKSLLNVRAALLFFAIS